MEETGTEEEGGNVEIVLNMENKVVGGTLSIGYGYGPDIKFPVEFNLDHCSTHQLLRLDLRAITGKVFSSIYNFLDKHLSPIDN